MIDLHLATRKQPNVFKFKNHIPPRASDGTVLFGRMNANIIHAAESTREVLVAGVAKDGFHPTITMEKPVGDPGKDAVGESAAEMEDKDIFSARWSKLRHKAKGWWGKLSDNDLDEVSGKFDKLIRILQIKYGYSRQQAEAEYKKRTK